MPDETQTQVYDFIAETKPKVFRYKFPLHVKHEAIELARKIGLKKASVLLNIHRKNINRWMNKGFFHKKGGGRKTSNPEMEKQIVEKSIEYIQKNHRFPPRQYVRSIARLYLSDHFKASKGWCDKFMKRNKAKFSKLLDELNKPFQYK